jgi:7-carboxy-7-deazaguanine synthase
MKVNEIFQSISGEVGDIPQGAVAWFIRFQKCNLSCIWCDTQHAQAVSETELKSANMTPEQIAEQIPRNANVILTGGEPLIQDHRQLYRLVSLLEEKDCLMQVETNGSIKPFLPICHVFDYKTPSSGMPDKMMDLHHFLECYGFPQTWIKFVIKDPEDLEFTLGILKEFALLRPGWHGLQMSISISSGEGVSYAISRLKEAMPSLIHRIVFNFQLHKHFNLK